MIELGACGLELLRDSELFVFEVVFIPFVVDEWRRDEELDFLRGVYLVHAGGDLSNVVGQRGLLYFVIIFERDEPHDGFGVLLDVEHDLVLEDVHICKCLLWGECVDDVLFFGVVFSE